MKTTWHFVVCTLALVASIVSLGALFIGAGLALHSLFGSGS